MPNTCQRKLRKYRKNKNEGISDISLHAYCHPFFLPLKQYTIIHLNFSRAILTAKNRKTIMNKTFSSK